MTASDPPVRVLVVWTTDLNSTRQMAEAVVAGARSVEGVVCENVCLAVGDEVGPDDVAGHDALIVGTPVRHRSMHHRVKRFVETALEASWLADRTVGMVGGAFSVGGGHDDAGAGAEMCQLGILAAMAASGMILVPLPKCTPGADHAGLHWGPAGRTGGPKMEPLWLVEAMTLAGHHHGANVARVARALKPARAGLFADGNVSPPPELAQAFADAPAAATPPGPGDNPAHRQAPPEGFVSAGKRPD